MLSLYLKSDYVKFLLTVLVSTICVLLSCNLEVSTPLNHQANTWSTGGFIVCSMLLIWTEFIVVSFLVHNYSKPLNPLIAFSIFYAGIVSFITLKHEVINIHIGTLTFYIIYLGYLLPFALIFGIVIFFVVRGVSKELIKTTYSWIKR